MSKEVKLSGSKSKHDHSASSILGFKPKSSDSSSHQHTKDESAGHYDEARKAINKKDYDKALECINKAIESNPAKPHYYARKVEVLAEMGQTAKAKETIEQINSGKSLTTPENKLTNRILDRIEKKHPELFSDAEHNTNDSEVPEIKESKETKHLSSLKKLIEGKNKSNSSDQVKELKQENEQLKQENKQLKKEKDCYLKTINDIGHMVVACENKAKSSMTNSKNHDNIGIDNSSNKEELGSSSLGGVTQDMPD